MFNTNYYMFELIKEYDWYLSSATRPTRAVVNTDGNIIKGKYNGNSISGLYSLLNEHNGASLGYTGNTSNGKGISFTKEETNESENTYKIDSIFSQSELKVDCKVNVKMENDSIIYEGVYTIQNLTAGKITINGVILRMHATTISPNTDVMINYTKLTEPLELESLGVGYVKFVITKQFPHNIKTPETLTSEAQTLESLEDEQHDTN